jgi:hypothetical protein
MPRKSTPQPASKPATPDPAALWHERTFTYGSLTITVRRKTVGSAMVRDSIRWVIENADFPGVTSGVRDGFAMYFARIVSQTVAVEGPLTLPDSAASPKELLVAFDAFRQWDGNLLDEWIRELNLVDRSPWNPAYWPKAQLTEEELKKMPPAASTGGASGGPSSNSSTAMETTPA